LLIALSISARCCSNHRTLARAEAKFSNGLILLHLKRARRLSEKREPLTALLVV
jgi:hypothetical protein